MKSAGFAGRRRGRSGPVHAHATVPIGPDGVRIVVVADTHGAPHPRAAEWIAAERPQHILHAGDIGQLRVLADLRTLAPVTAVRGNIDEIAPDLPDAVTIELRDAEGAVLRLLLVHSAVYGPKLRADVARLARAEGATAVVCGHSHVPFFGRDQGLVILNPGSIGPRRFHLPIVFGVLSVSRTRLAFEHVDCETGARWAP